MNGKISLMLIVVLMLAMTGCQNKREENKEVIAETKAEVQNKQTETARRDLLFNATTDEFIYIEAENLTVDGLNSTLKSDLNNDGIKETFQIKRDTPNGIIVLGTIDECNINFLNEPNAFTSVDVFDDSGLGEPKGNYYFQLTTYDLDSDGIKEVIVSIGDKALDMETAIFRLTDSKDFPFKLVGSLGGQEFLYVGSDNKIVAPYGSQGFVETYLYKDDRLFSAKKDI